MTPTERFVYDTLVAALFDVASDPLKDFAIRLAARAALAKYDEGPIGRALRHADASRAAPKSAAQS